MSLSGLDDQVAEHMDKQPYAILCTCGNELVIDKYVVDGDNDLHLTVKPCSECCKE